jgi:flagellar FliJ protein
VSGFRLAALMRVRRLQEDVAAGRAVAAAAQVTAAEEVVVERTLALGSSAPPASADESTWRAAVAARTALSSLLTESRGLAAARADDAVRARAEWAAARTRVRPLERLAERHAREVAEEEVRAEQLLLDEHAGRAGRAGAASRSGGDETATVTSVTSTTGATGVADLGGAR